MKRFVIAGTVLAFVPVAAFAQTPQDLAFVQMSTHVDLVSVQEGQNAVTAATNPAVKSFAQHEVQYHTESNRTLAPMLPPAPTTLDPCRTWQARLVLQTTGAAFDGAYLQATIYNHQRLVNVLQGEIQTGNDANLKAFAQKALPSIQGHLAEAQQLLNGSPAKALPARIVVRPNFQSGQWGLSPADKQSMHDFAQKLTGMQQVTVTATGYTDNVGIGPDLQRQGIPTNEVLSEKRAESVKEYLVSQGLPAAEITTRGMGAASPVASNDTESGRAQNRRVEVDVTATPATAQNSMQMSGSGIPDCTGT